MSGNTSTRWLGLLNEKKAAFINQGCELPSTISSERSFCSHFERLCRDHNEKYYTRLLVKLQYGSINAFASAVDAVMEYAPPNSLAGVVAGGVFMAFKARATLQIDRMRGWTLIEF